jgi:hypothetical protein
MIVIRIRHSEITLLALCGKFLGALAMGLSSGMTTLDLLHRAFFIGFIMATTRVYDEYIHNPAYADDIKITELYKGYF